MNKIMKYAAVFGILMMGLAAAFPAQAAEPVKAGWVNAENGAAIDALNLAAGEEVVIRLTSEVPENKVLNAYSLMILYDESALKVKEAVAAPEAAIAPANINEKTPGELVVNGFDITGAAGKTTISIVDVTLVGKKSGESKLSVLFTAYGAGAADEFRPETVEPITVTVE